MTVALGWRPQDFTVQLSGGGDFVATLVSQPAWPVGTAMELHFSVTQVESSPIVWPATVTGDTASWDVVATEVDAVLSVNACFVRLYYISGGSTIVWMSGRVAAT